MTYHRNKIHNGALNRLSQAGFKDPTKNM